MSRPLPQTVRITNLGWTEDRGAYKAQIGNSEETVAYAWAPGGSGGDAHERVMQIAIRICEAWNTASERSAAS